MIKPLLLSLFLSPCVLLAQPNPVPDAAYTGGNGIKALINANGALFYDFEKGQFLTDELGRSPIRAAGVWIGGLDPGGNLKLAAQLYNEDGKQDFVPGMANLSQAGNLHWNKVWRARAEDVLYHREYYFTHFAIKDTLPSIFGWPGKGNQFFKQFNGFDLPDNEMLLAPFYDENRNGTYEPDKGEAPTFAYDNCNAPVVPNDMVWHVFHDNMPHTETSAIPVNMTVQSQVSTFDCIDNKVAANAVVLHYSMINNALEDIDSCYFGMFVDFQVGCPNDDYIATIPGQNIVYAYNADGFDEDCGGYKGYGEHPPAIALKLIWGPFNEFRELVPLSSLMVIPENPTQQGQEMPEMDIEYYNYLTGSWKDGTPLTSGGDGYNPSSLDFTKFHYPGQIGDTSGWTELNAGNLPGRRRVIASFGPFRLQPGEVNQLLLGFAFFPNESKTNTGITDEVDFYLHKAFDFLYSGCDDIVFPGCETNIEIPEIPQPRPIFSETFLLSPIPASDELQILFRDEKAAYNLEIHDFLGRLVFKKNQISDRLKVDVSNWARGTYVATVKSGRERIAKPFVVMWP